MDGFSVDAAELDRAAERTRLHHEEFAIHPATGWSLSEQHVRHDDLGQALSRFQRDSRRALEVLGADWAELADRLAATAERYRSAEATVQDSLREHR